MKTAPENLGITPQANMVLIGGGTYAGTARPLLEMGLDLSGRIKPNVLIVPTPKNRPGDFAKLANNGRKMYGSEIGTKVDILHDFGTMPDAAELQEKFDAADVVYISGGSTDHAMNVWKKHGVDTMLTDAMREGKVMTGISAGALTWFNDTHSASEKFEVEKGQPWNFREVHGLGHIDTLASAHFSAADTFDQRLRSDHFKDLLARRNKQTGLIEYGLGMDNDAGIVATGGLVRVVTTSREADIHVATRHPDGKYTQSPLDTTKSHVSATHTSIDQLPDDGISWDEFYRQLGKK
jgi:dipeptidase E